MRHPPRAPLAEPEPPRVRSACDAPAVRWWEWALLAVAFVALVVFCAWLGAL